MTAADTYLLDEIIALIRAQGPLRLDYFITQALCDPVHGYYMRREPFGKEGDFITAPEVSQMFGELIGLWCADFFTRMPATQNSKLIELGPGRGTLMTDALRALRQVGVEATELALHLVETSPRLIAEQKIRLGALMDAQVEWHRNFADIAPGPFILIANEFFDALPVRQFICEGQIWRERFVGLGGDGRSLEFELSENPVETPRSPLAAHAAPGAIIEISEERENLMTSIAARLVRHGGAALIVDYGTSEGGLGDSLQAVSHHIYAPVLANPGLADLTTHVDFASLVRCARREGAEIYGPVTQASFLSRLGITTRACKLGQNVDKKRADKIDRELERLIGAKEMGTLFKVLCVTSKDSPVPAGFEPIITRHFS